MIQTNGAAPVEKKAPIPWGNSGWKLEIDPVSGALVHIENRADPQHMNWVREAGRWEDRKWLSHASDRALTQDGQWGLVETAQTGLLHVAQVRQLSDQAWEAEYTSAALTVIIRRELDVNDDLNETYTFRNTGAVHLNFPLGTLAITAPFFDQYPAAEPCLAARCHTHLWMGGSAAWINAIRMGGESPHLGLVVTQGSLDAYSQRGGTFNDRGIFLLHPRLMNLKLGASESISWKLFWHQGWDDFFSRLKATKGFVRLSAKHYVVPAGQSLEIMAESAAPLDSAQIRVVGQPVDTHVENGRLIATIPTTKPGELIVELHEGSRKTWLRANITSSINALIAARVKFIVRHHQCNAAGTPLDGAYLSFDNETGKQIYDADIPDHNAGRERLAMGVLGALYLPLCHDDAFRTELKQSLFRYFEFVTRELEDESGIVYSTVGRLNKDRLYNAPWVAQFHLAMYRATGDIGQLDRFVQVLRSYYAQGGAKFYAIGIPITDGLKTLAETGRTQERAELLGNLRAQADYFLKTGSNYPSAEVNYEQSIVAPGIQFLAEMALATGDQSYLEGAKLQMPLLKAFCGKQPDFRLYEVGIRHWDNYWFGKLGTYGDTMPHHWSTLNALAYVYYGLASQDPSWFPLADAVVKSNLSLFKPDGSAACAHLYAFATNGQRGNENDPWANDQDWALVNLLIVTSVSKSEDDWMRKA